MTDIEYMQTPAAWYDRWPPVCPLIRRVNGEMQFAYITNDQPVIYHGNIFTRKPSDRAERFTSHTAIIAAGWKID